jgi:hypothetical protein
VTAEVKLAVPMTDWGTFMWRSADYIDAGRLAACFDNAFSPELCERLRGASRLQDRLSQLIDNRYALAAPIAEDVIEDGDRTIALSPAERLLDLIRRAGAIYWANAIANVVLAEEVRWLHEQLGGALCAFALANRDLSGPGETLEPLVSVSERITEDGERCFAAWCQSLPEAVGARVRLKLSARYEPSTYGPGEGLAESFAAIGPSIVRRAAS